MESTSKHRRRPKLCRFGLALLVLAAAAAVLSFSCKASTAEETEEIETDTYYKLTLSSSGNGTYKKGSVVTLTAVPASGYYLGAWAGTNGADVYLDGSAWKIAMNADKSVQAAFGRYSVALGSGFTLALKKDGTLWVCGVNGEGQLGIGTAGGNELFLVAGPSISNVTDLAAGWYHGLALTSSGEVYAWGVNTYGQCGNGTTGSAQTTPVQASGLTGVKALAGGQNHSFALKADGTVWAWGLNTYGQCGDGTTTSPRTSPVQVSGLAGVAAIAAGTITGYALLADGTVRAWGGDNSGQLGNDAALAESYVPVQVAGISDAVSVHAANGYHAFVVTESGEVLAWGRSNYGQLGDGTTTNRATPVSGPSPSGGWLLIGRLSSRRSPRSRGRGECRRGACRGF